MSRVEQTMKKADAGKSIALPENFEAVSQRLSTLGDDVDQMISTLTTRVSPKITLADARREVLKANLELEGLETLYNDTLGLDLVGPKARPALIAVTKVRDSLGELFHNFESRYEAVRSTIKEVTGKVDKKHIDELTNLQSLIKQEGAKIQEMLNETPELGMTQDEWDELTLAERRGLRNPGRPKPPIEAQIIKARKRVHDLVATVNMLSKGKIRTVDAAIKGVELTRRGRPQISEVSKLDRKLATLVKRLEDISRNPSKMQDLRKARLIEQIEALRQEIEEHDKGLKGVDLYRRQLEKLRARHRDLVVAEIGVTGQEQAALLLDTARNEAEQLVVINKIREIDPEARVTVTHKVNPAQTMERFKRLRNNGLLKEAELAEVDEIEKAMSNSPFSRNR